MNIRVLIRSTCESAGLGATAQTDSNLAELNYGNHDGLRTSEIHERRPHWNV
jgi:probable phosphoglycerate mutase